MCSTRPFTAQHTERTLLCLPPPCRTQSYQSDLNRKGIVTAPYPWASIDDEEAMFAALRVGNLPRLKRQCSV